jgi:hypothetical protein
LAKKKLMRAERIYRKLTEEEAKRVTAVRSQIRDELPELREKARIVFLAHEASRKGCR